ncbi:hypothetical protein Poly59_06660 [Rubripirellula reticaptiva]|uniref:Uncharacterized protein n=1 Tax=Rubripirellula reticaptiva TaxID=2528013 RepID=A0A5C6FAZ8_9BACT|nr:hypothetical protein Poly59_06660 [Rubripirellula reticaptiva]
MQTMATASLSDAKRALNNFETNPAILAVVPKTLGTEVCVINCAGGVRSTELGCATVAIRAGNTVCSGNNDYAEAMCHLIGKFATVLTWFESTDPLCKLAS